ncbi:hypothetical protein [Limnobaculum xujianqingii]|uniref:hypothetical protein n=1 Tax=Limnobaculum xujianqingii TaxID=2738837 RepID=UPI00112613B1|nr:hypothetical protein [Limnobaculum xujianqingii]
MSSYRYLLLIGAFLLLALAAFTFFRQSQRLADEVQQVTRERDAAKAAQTAQAKQFNREAEFSALAGLSALSGEIKTERVKIEIREKVKTQPCASEHINSDAARQLWDISGRGRAAIHTTSRKSDSNNIATATGK